MDIKITGLEEIDANFRKLSDEKTLERNVGRSLKKAMKPVLDMARTLVPVDEGDLKRSLTVSVRKNRKGNRSARVGPDTKTIVRAGADGALDFKKKKRPANYAHLVEYGHHSAAKTGQSGFGAKGTKRKKGTFAANSFVMGQPFLRPAWDKHSPGAMAVFKEEMERGLVRVMRKAGLSG